MNIDPEEWMRSIGRLRKNWGKWWNSGAREKFNAILYVLRNRKPPWEFRYAQRDLTITDGVVDSIEVWFEVDHAKKRIVVTKLDVPPRD